MQQILDLHIHSKYSRACSKQLNLADIDQACRIKGIDIVATGDFTYPAWFANIKNELIEIEDTGLFKLKTAKDDKVKFILSTELALIYKDKEKCRRIHIMVTAPNLESAEKLNKLLDRSYNIRSDGRPILGISAPDLVKMCLDIHPKFLIYPAHIWTPWFAVFGSKSGFNSMEECFHEQTKHIYAFETGLSSDPEMNWRVSELNNLTLLSNSDAHSLSNLAREANVFDLKKITYNEIYKIIKNKNKDKIKYTIEFYPEEGMYHYDGHHNCNICFSPAESKKHNNICPKCKKPLIIGVLNRVGELSDQTEGFRPNNASDFKKLVGLDKIIAESFNIKSRSSKRVLSEYHNLIQKIGSELHILLDADLKKIEEIGYTKVAKGIEKMRNQDLIIAPGFDGQYGVIKIFNDNEKIMQKSIF